VPRRIPALVQPALLVWAREQAGLTLEGAASRAGVESGALQQWEQGADRPTIPQLRKLGEAYKRPLAVFFLPKPPQGFDAQREFRRLPGLAPRTESPELRLALRTALFRREAARELYQRLEEPIPQCNAVVRPTQDEEVVAQTVRGLLGITWASQLVWPSPYAALNAWRGAIEAQGVLVFQTGDVELSEMRGTSIPHGPLPVILLNNADAPHGRIFTLLHEFIHILLGNGGHRTSTMEGKQFPEDQVLERVSNRFAAAVLMPCKEFLAEVVSYSDALAGSDDGLRRLAGRIKVSPEAILRRLLVLHRVRASVYRQKRRDWQQRSWYSPPTAVGGPPIEVQRLAALGRPFISLVLEGFHRSAVSSADVVDYLGIQLKYLNKLAGALALGPGSTVI
jgi:Zn-dependent peptidase ImmA (M78 family)/transcriptional regulator with XRE-family HTH domain